MKHILLASIAVLFALFSNGQQKLAVGILKVESKTNPLGIDNEQPFFSWVPHSYEKNITQTAYRIIVSDDSIMVSQGMGNYWDSKKIFSDASFQIRYIGKPLEAAKTYFWKVINWDNKNRMASSEIGKWQMGLLSVKDWNGAEWIAYDTLPNTKKIVPAVHGNGKKEWGKRSDVLPLMRKDFLIEKEVKSATLFICGLGQFEAYINGKKIGDHFLDPGWTDYSKQALYVSFDVTGHVQNNANAIGVILGNGFYYIPSERYRKMTGAFGYPKMICRLMIVYKDGTTKNILSDETWKADKSPITFSSIYGGEDYDATLEQDNWNNTGFNDSRWKKVLLTDGPILSSQKNDPIKGGNNICLVDVRNNDNIKSRQLAKAVWVFDMILNQAAVPAIKVKGKRGDTIKIITGELLKEDGSVSQKATGAPHYYSYVLKGDKIWELFVPKFTYYGFRYIQVEGVSFAGKDKENYPELIMLGKGGGSAVVGLRTIICSNKLFFDISILVLNAISSNFQSILTDCPTREKLGWLEQVHLMGNSIQLHMDMQSISKKIMQDIRLAQEPSGLIPSTVPEYTKMEFANGWFRDSPEWGSTGVILPWYLYKWYGDKQALIDNYEYMKRYVNYLGTKDSSSLLMYGLSDWYDLGPNKPGFCQLTPLGLTATAYYYYDLTIIEKTARLLGKIDDANVFAIHAQKVKLAFNKAFFNSQTKQYGSGSQTSNAIAVYMQLVDEKDKAAVIENIVKDIRNRNNCFTTGDIGFRYLLKVLSDAGMHSLIYDMNIRTDVPGYGYQLKKGATALTESWQALPTASNNHLMLGHILEWFVEGLAGIKQEESSIAYKSIIIKPNIIGDISSAEFGYNSVHGMISSSWELKKDSFMLAVVIPMNTTATVYLPAKKNAVITEQNDNKIVKPLRFENGYSVLKVGSGMYRFVVK